MLQAFRRIHNDIKIESELIPSAAHSSLVVVQLKDFGGNLLYDDDLPNILLFMKKASMNSVASEKIFNVWALTSAAADFLEDGDSCDFLYLNWAVLWYCSI